jgi:hypothetical protein
VIFSTIPSHPQTHGVGLGISDKKIIPRKTELTEHMVFSIEFFSGCSAEQKILGISFRTLPRKRKQLGIPFRETKIEANSRNSLPNPSAEEKQLGIPFRTFSGKENNSEFRSVEKNIRKKSEFHSKKTTQNKTRQRQSMTVFKLRVLLEAARIGFHHPG